VEVDAAALVTSAWLSALVSNTEDVASPEYSTTAADTRADGLHVGEKSSADVPEAIL
jgi:hypothetical protein